MGLPLGQEGWQLPPAPSKLGPREHSRVSSPWVLGQPGSTSTLGMVAKGPGQG